jgi:hypothetical protein
MPDNSSGHSCSGTAEEGRWSNQMSRSMEITNGNCFMTAADFKKDSWQQL